MTKEEIKAIIKNGKDVDISKISSCPFHSIDECESNCIKYSNCYSIAYANDLLKEYEDNRKD